MKPKRLISLWLLCVYLLVMCGPACLSLSCECVSASAPSSAEMCCCHCGHEAGSADECLKARCCDDRHSTETTLYTGAFGDGERQLRCVVTQLPPALAAECPEALFVPSLRTKPAERHPAFVSGPALLPVGFRAPPV